MGETMQPVETTQMLSKVAEQGALFAFMLLVIIALFFVCKTLYNRNVMLGDSLVKIITDNTVSNNNSTLALTALTRQIEVLNNVR